MSEKPWAIVIYDSGHELGATAAVAMCVGRVLNDAGVAATVCKLGDACPDPIGYDLVVVGSPVYYERPMPSVIDYLVRHGGLEGVRVAVFITCFAASKRVPRPFREAVAGHYIAQILKHVKGEVTAVKAFKGWLRKPDASMLKECGEWGRELAKVLME